MAGRQKEIYSPDRTVRAKKPIGKISILICIFMAALVISGVFWIVDLNVKIHIAEKALSELKTAAYSAEKANGGSDDVFVRNMALQKEAIVQSNKHSIALENREHLTLTGIKEVADFNERKIVLLTEPGHQLTITGRSLKIIYFKTITGALRVDGIIDSLVYTDMIKSKERFWERLKETFA